MYSKEQIIEIIKTSKKYSDIRKFVFSGDNISYILDGIKYNIITYTNRSRLYFEYRSYIFNMKGLSVSVTRDLEKETEKKVLSKFREIVRFIDKYHYYIKLRENDLKRIEPAILKYLKSEFDIELENLKPEPLSGDNFYGTNVEFYMNFPNSVIQTKYKSRSTSFDALKDKAEDLKYIIKLSVYLPHLILYLNFKYSSLEKKLILLTKEERYKNLSKDITKIIRGEKLKKILSNE